MVIGFMDAFPSSWSMSFLVDTMFVLYFLRLRVGIELISTNKKKSLDGFSSSKLFLLLVELYHHKF